MKNKLLPAILFLGGLIVVIMWMQGGFHSKVQPGRTPIPEKQSKLVKTMTVAATRSLGEVTVPGSVVPRETAEIAARIQGHVKEIEVDAGSRVSKGDVLLRLDNKEMTDRLAQAKAALAGADADLVKAKADYDRFKSLLAKESVAQKVFDDADARYGIARAAQDRAKAALAETGTILSYGLVKAPFDGIVSERDVNEGDLVRPGRILFRLFDPSTVEMEAQAGEQYIPFLKVGTMVSVLAPSIDLKQKSKIREVVPRTDERTRTITVKAPLTETPGLRPGLYGTLTFHTKSSLVITIPKGAVGLVGQLETVRVMENGTVKIRHIKTGRTLKDKVEALSGLNEGDVLVLD